jgi:hypothetical protein
LFGVFDMARFFKGRRRRGLTIARLLLRHSFLGVLIPALAGRFISGDEAHGSRQRLGLSVTPRFRCHAPCTPQIKLSVLKKCLRDW